MGGVSYGRYDIYGLVGGLTMLISVFQPWRGLMAAIVCQIIGRKDPWPTSSFHRPTNIRGLGAASTIPD